MRRYLPTDWEEMAGWYRARGMAPVPADVLPSYGLIELDVAAGFVYLTDSQVAMFDAFVTNPARPSADRGAALDAIIEELLHFAGLQGRTRNLVLTREESMVQRASTRGLRLVEPYTVLVGG